MRSLPGHPARAVPLTWLELPLPSPPSLPCFTFCWLAPRPGRSFLGPPVARKVDLCLYLDSDRGSRPIKTRTAAVEEARKKEGGGSDMPGRGASGTGVGGDVEWMEKGFKGALTLSHSPESSMASSKQRLATPLTPSLERASSGAETDRGRLLQALLPPSSFRCRASGHEHPHHSHSPPPLCRTKELSLGDGRKGRAKNERD